MQPRWINGNTAGSRGGDKGYKKYTTGIPWLHGNIIRKPGNGKSNTRTSWENTKI